MSDAVTSALPPGSVGRSSAGNSVRRTEKEWVPEVITSKVTGLGVVDEGSAMTSKSRRVTSTVVALAFGPSDDEAGSGGAAPPSPHETVAEDSMADPTRMVVIRRMILLSECDSVDARGRRGHRI